MLNNFTIAPANVFLQADKRIIYFLNLLFLFFQGCNSQGDTQFTSLGKGKTGIDFRNVLVESPELNVLNYLYFYNGAGIAVGDVDNDGLQDLFFAGNMVKNRLFLNKGDFEFSDATEMSGVAAQQGWCTGATMADVNGDGWIDIYVCRSADVRPEKRRNLLFINQGLQNGKLQFVEKGAEYGIDDAGYSTHAAFFDMDRDGDLDLFVANHSLSEYTGVKLEMNQLKHKKNPDYSSKLYRNDGGHFSDVSEAAGITGNVLSFGLGIGISDANGDDWPDIYVCNDFNEQDYLFLNNRDGTFSDQLPTLLDHTSLFSMGCDWTDLNNDGAMELVSVDMLPEDNFTQKMHMGAENYNKFQGLFRSGFYYQYSRNMLHLNNGNGTFSEIGQLAGVSNTDWSWAALGADFDNDGLQDLFVTNGYVKDYTDMDFLKYTMDQAAAGKRGKPTETAAELLKTMKGSQLANYLFHNQSETTGSGQVPVFKNVADEWGLGKRGWSYGAVYADLDNDGDLDLVTNDINTHAPIYRNNSERKNQYHWLKITLYDPTAPGNRAAIGAKVQVWAGGQLHYRELMPSRGYASSVDFNLHFGLGQYAMVDSIFVIWPDGQRQRHDQTPANQTLKIEKQAASHTFAKPAPTQPLFTPTLPLPYRHREDPNQVDFKTQTLLPHFISHQGPCLAQGDLNGDGRPDLFAGGSKNQAGSLLAGQTNGNFLPLPCPDMEADKASEDVGTALFDADGDGDLDLYVVSGGYAFAQDAAALQDRLYLNNGKGGFSRTLHALPLETNSGSCARTADVDGDGDLDLFVGGRVVPGRWPETPVSMLLINDGKGHFANKTDELAPGLSHIGMVTDAAWADLDGDHLPELMLAGEWMAPHLFVNQKGRLLDQSTERLPVQLGGWWNSLVAEDIDGDGDTDFAIGNLGLNTQLRATAVTPATLHAADFDENGSTDPIISWFLEGKSYPAAFRDDLADQLPMLKKRFNDYQSYAKATTKDLFNPEQWAKAQQWSAEEFRSGWLQNTNGHFIFHPFPMEAQFAPIYAMLCFDTNGDGYRDLLLAGNQYHSRIRFGRYDANHGLLLLGDGKGAFRPAPALISGFSVREAVRSAVLVPAKKGGTVFFGVNDGPVLGYSY